MQVELIGDGFAGQAQAGPSPKLVHAAHEFEGQMMKELLKPMTGGDVLFGDDDADQAGTGSGDALGEFAAEALGQALSEHGGLGIADRIIKELPRPTRDLSNRDMSEKVTTNLHVNTVMRGHQ